MLFSLRNRANWRVRVGLRALLVSLFFFGSHPQVFDPLEGYSPLRESWLVSFKDFVETATLTLGFKSKGGQGEENFLVTAAHDAIQVQRPSIFHVNHKLEIRKLTLVGFFLIRAPPAKRAAYGFSYIEKLGFP